MCTQQIIWCNCGHGELLPIERCPKAIRDGWCYTILHGNHDIVVPDLCSYCKDGLNGLKPLVIAIPTGELAERLKLNGTMIGGQEKDEKILTQAEGVVIGGKEGDETRLSKTENGSEQPWRQGQVATEQVPEYTWDDVMSTEFGEGFDLSGDMWQYH